MILYLIGFMGSGKSTTGTRLASKLGWEFIDLDTEIENKTGLTISQIFSEKGEEFFRSLETELLHELGNRKDLVISCGGGTPCFNNNMDYMNSRGHTIYLKLQARALTDRLIKSSANRPLIKGLSEKELQEYIEAALHNREPYYNMSKSIIKGLSLDLSQLIDHLKSEGLYNPL